MCSRCRRCRWRDRGLTLIVLWPNGRYVLEANKERNTSWWHYMFFGHIHTGHAGGDYSPRNTGRWEDTTQTTPSSASYPGTQLGPKKSLSQPILFRLFSISVRTQWWQGWHDNISQHSTQQKNNRHNELVSQNGHGTLYNRIDSDSE